MQFRPKWCESAPCAAEGTVISVGKSLLVALVTVVALAAAAGPRDAQAQPAPETVEARAAPVLIEEGRHLAELNCSSCHAVARQGDSLNAQAPPFRLLSKNYPIDALDEAFAEGAFVGHSNMPQFQFTPGQIEALTAYIQSIQNLPDNSHPH
jgi:mono/diheme cytochrome c family protein